MLNMNIETLTELISNSQIAFLNGKLQEAFSLAKEAIKLDENCADAYQCAANVCMSLSRYEDAIEYYQQAIRCEPDNGNRYSPSDYSGYQVAYIMLKQANRLEDAYKELRYARQNLMNFPFALCNDMVNFELTAY